MRRDDAVILAGVVVSLATYMGMRWGGLDHRASATGAVTVLCLIWWIAEPIPIPVTALIPIGGFPLLGVLEGPQIASAYGSPLILLLMGGFLLSRAMEAQRYPSAHRAGHGCAAGRYQSEATSVRLHGRRGGAQHVDL